MSALHIAIIGTGSGAFAAAIKAAENGARITMIECAEVIGGTCVNIGCVPSKILIRGAHIAYLQGHHTVEGLPLNKPQIDRRAMVAQQQGWVDKLRHTKYERILEDNPGITLLRGMARFDNNDTLIITKSDGTEKTIKADRILLASGRLKPSPFSVCLLSRLNPFSLRLRPTALLSLCSIFGITPADPEFTTRWLACLAEMGFPPTGINDLARPH